MREIEPGVFVPNMRYKIQVEGTGDIYSNDAQALRNFCNARTTCWNPGNITILDADGEYLGEFSVENPAVLPEEALEPGSNLWYLKDHQLLRFTDKFFFAFCSPSETSSWHWSEEGYTAEIVRNIGYQEVSLDFLLNSNALESTAVRTALATALV